MRRRVTFLLIALLTIALLASTSPERTQNGLTDVIVPTAHAADTDCKVVKDVCHDIWYEAMMPLCIQNGGRPSTCEELAYFNYTTCVLQNGCNPTGN